MSNNSVISSQNGQDTSELNQQNCFEIFQLQTKQRQETIKFCMQIVTILNISSALIMIFSNMFYMWLKVTNQNRDYVWVNLLYVYTTMDDSIYMSYNYYLTQPYNICLQSGSDTNSCYSAIKRLQWAGVVSFILIMFSILLQIYDIIRLNNMLFKITRFEKIKNKISGQTLYTTLILLRVSALLFYFVFGVSETTFQTQVFGICYWLMWMTSLSMIVFAVAYHKQKSRYQRFIAMNKLVEDQNIRVQSISMEQNQKQCEMELKKIDLKELDD